VYRSHDRHAIGTLARAVANVAPIAGDGTKQAACFFRGLSFNSPLELANELRMSKVMQLCAAIAARGFVLPKHLNVMRTLAYVPLRCS
jgi:hypothetical protein